MPTLLRKNGFRFFFYSNEDEGPPHVHVIGRGGEAKIWLNPIEISRAYNLSRRDQLEILKITRENVKLLTDGWKEWHEPRNTKK